MEKQFIRPYIKNDRNELLRISADTAVFGEPVEAILEDRRVFCDAFSAYYTDYESDYAWVALINGQIVGYLTGCLDTAAQRRRWMRHVFPYLIINLIQGRYKIGRKTRGYVLALAGGRVRNEFPRVDHVKYPAHLHINVEKSARGRGLGRLLIEAYLVQLNQLGVPGVFLETTNINEAACGLYESVGFEIIDHRETKVWRDVVQIPVVNLSYGKILAE